MRPLAPLMLCLIFANTWGADVATLADVDRAAAAYILTVANCANGVPKPTTARPAVELDKINTIDSNAERAKIQEGWRKWSAYDSVMRQAGTLKALLADPKAERGDIITRAAALANVLEYHLAPKEKLAEKR